MRYCPNARSEELPVPRRQVRIKVQTRVRVQRTVRATRQTRLQSAAGVLLPSPTEPSNAARQLSSPQRPALMTSGSRARLLRDEGYAPLPEDEREYDLFICHASEDKDFVRPLVTELEQLSIRVWFDETAIRVGDSLRRSIDRGLVRSRFGVVVFSRAFFAKNWTNYELDGLVAREMQGRKVVLPVWHEELTAQDMLGYSPSLADKRALLAAELSTAEIAGELAALIRPDGL